MNDNAQDGGAGQDQPEPILRGRDIVTVTSTLAALLTTFILVHPWILVISSLMKWTVFSVVAVLSLLIATYPYVPILERRIDMTPLTRWLLFASGGMLCTLLYQWPPPTAQLIAQQVLANQGMFLRRVFYQTAWEVGNVEGVRLFHEAGFNRSLAFELLGEPAETVRDRRVVDVVLTNEPTVLDNLLRTLLAACGESHGQGSTGSI